MMMSSEVLSASEPVMEGGESGSTESLPSPEGDSSSVNGKSSTTADPKICGVCGDKALGNNFNAITCESCKAFFRRNALRTKEFVCPFSNSCKVDAITRRFCQRCRLKKCFDIGMKKEWIMTDDEKRLKKQKIEQNRLKRSSLENSTRKEDDGDVPAAKLQRSDSTLEDENMNDDNLGSANLPKQPMRVHNNNEQSMNPKKVKDNRPSVIAIEVNSESQPEMFVQHFSPEGHDQLSLLPQTVAPQTHFHEALAAPGSAVNPQSWMNDTEGDSSSSNSSSVSLSQPPPLVKYPPNKRQKFFGKQEPPDPIQEAVTSNQMPLLSSLIRPGCSESSPDHSNSPPAVLQASTGFEGDDDTMRVAARTDDMNVFPRSSNSVPNHEAVMLPHSPPPEMPTYVESYINGNHHSPQIQSSHHHVTPNYGPNDNHDRFAHETGSNHNNNIQMEDRRATYDSSKMPPNHRDPRMEQPEQEIPLLPLNTLDSILSVAIAAEFNAFGMLGRNSSRELNKAEQAKLSELLLASQALHAPVDAERPIKVSEASDPSLLNVINLTEIAIRRLIKTSKKISGFKNMCQEDQVALLKGGCTEMMILRSVVTYDPLKDSWQIPHSNPGQYNIQLGVLKEARGNLYEEHQRFVKSFRPEWRKDESIMSCLCAITLFTPERANVVHTDVVKLEQDSYYYLLKRYLESILNGCEAKSTYLQLIRKIAELRALNQSHVRVFLEMNPKEVEPLLIEIFDLK